MKQSAQSHDFLVIPAIDLMEGACVRLQQGDSSRKTRYPVDAALVAQNFEQQGAQRIHVIDLDGAFEGLPKNIDTIKRIRSATNVEIEVGGGIREEDTIHQLLDLGINYVILGTRALEDTRFLVEMVKRFGEHVILGADARDGLLSTRGWTQMLQIKARDYLEQVARQLPKLKVIYTDIARDGMFTSPNFEALADLLTIDNIEVIASGGVGSLEDIQKLAALNNARLRGVIVGKAIYDGRVDLAQAILLTKSLDRG